MAALLHHTARTRLCLAYDAGAGHINGMGETVELLLSYKGFAVAFWIGAFFVAERLWPAAPRPLPRADEPPAGWQRLTRNAALWVLNIGLSLSIVVPFSLWAADHALAWRPAWWQGWPGLLLDLLLLDGLIYWWHRANHELPFLWRFHEVHHLDRFLDTTSAVRFHFGEVFLSAMARGAIILLFAIPIGSVLVFETLVLAAAIFHHSNLRLPAGLERLLSLLVVTPSIHWVHHHARRRDTDSNYATVLSLWDRLFGSRSPTRRRLDMTIGVEREAELSLPRLLARPFRRRATAPVADAGLR